MQEHRIYYLYCIENKVNSKIYVGVHSTENFDDGYMGSGVALRKAINKYGIENFEKSIIKFFGSSDEMYLAESEIVDAQFVNSPLTYNMKIGGFGGFPINDTAGNKNGFYGKTHSIESRLKMQIAARKKRGQRKTPTVKMQGENNPMYGKSPTNSKSITINGTTFSSIKQASIKLNIPYSTLKNRIRMGYY